MQVFGFRLGNSSDCASPSHEYSLMKLEDELGESLLEQMPVLNQFYIRLSPIQHGKGRHVNNRCAIPSFAQFALVECSRLSQSCRFTTKAMHDIMWERIEGFVCPFRIIQQAWLGLYGDASVWRSRIYTTQWVAPNHELQS